MQMCTEHVRYQLPSKHTKVGYVLEVIEMSDATLLEAMENTEEETTTTWKRNNFESAVTYIIPKDPVATFRNNSNKRNQALISDTSAQGQDIGSKVGIGYTGAHFRYHKNSKNHDINNYHNKDIGYWRKERRKQVVVFKINNNNRIDGFPYKNQKAMDNTIENKVE